MRIQAEWLMRWKKEWKSVDVPVEMKQSVKTE